LKRPHLFLILVILLVMYREAGALDFAQTQTRHFNIYFAETLSPGGLSEVKDAFESAYAAMEAGVGSGDRRAIDVVIFKETGDFTAQTKLPFWSASAMIDGSIYLQPVHILKERGVLESTVIHEVCLALLRRRFGSHVPLWFSEGLAVYYAGEIDALKKGLSGRKPDVKDTGDIDALLSNRTDREKNRWGYVLAYEEVAKAIEGQGRASARRGRSP
jgi:hypothetical protein